jgi:CBS domain-containing protein
MGKAVAIDSNQAVREAIDKMVQTETFSLLVEKKGFPVGVITDRDIFRRCLTSGRLLDKVRVEEIMSSPIITIDSNVRVGEALKTMVEKNVRRLYVTEGDKVVGRITHMEISQTLVDVLIALHDISQQL